MQKKYKKYAIYDIIQTGMRDSMGKEHKIPKEQFGNKRDNYLSWDETFMLSAVVSSARSKDPSSQVGACIVGKDNRILSLGYNGAPNSWNDDKFPWQRTNENPNYTKYPYVIHAEMNALLNYKGDNKDLIGSTAYVTLFPCSNCAKFLAQAGVKRIVYLSDKYNETEDNTASKICLTSCGIEFEEFPKELQRSVVVSLNPDKGISEEI